MTPEQFKEVQHAGSKEIVHVNGNMTIFPAKVI